MAIVIAAFLTFLVVSLIAGVFIYTVLDLADLGFGVDAGDEA
jgi:hypothetical protein